MNAMKIGTALITGASSGIGLELARLLAARKHDLVLVARNEQRLVQLAEELHTAHGVAVTTFASDLARQGAAQEVYDFTKGRGLEIEVLVNNAGVGLYGEHSGLGLERVDQMLQLNVTTLTEFCRLYAPDMKARTSGRILNIASTAAYQPTPFFAAYGASKAYVLNFSEALAMELVDHGVSVSCLSPGPTDTGFFGEIDQNGLEIAHFAKSGRHDALTVARTGLEMLLSGELSRIVGTKNYWRAAAGRFAPRSMVAKISKGIMRSAMARPPASG
ncbi:SDR family oxidoreductase [Pendulispora rubella]|uniref:SDR family oxidoreductase n=1 Tax=Pendulispora rubella TaxID=2741070 RepID=A0ABZ2KYC6_9BACT